MTHLFSFLYPGIFLNMYFISKWNTCYILIPQPSDYTDKSVQQLTEGERKPANQKAPKDGAVHTQEWNCWAVFSCVQLTVCFIAQSCPTLCDPVHVAPQLPLSIGILQARLLEWVSMPSSMVSSQPGIESRFPTLQADSLPSVPPEKPKNARVGSLSLLQGDFRNWTRASCGAGGFFTSWATWKSR